MVGTLRFADPTHLLRASWFETREDALLTMRVGQAYCTTAADRPTGAGGRGGPGLYWRGGGAWRGGGVLPKPKKLPTPFCGAARFAGGGFCGASAALGTAPG